MLSQRCRQCPNVDPALRQCIVFTVCITIFASLPNTLTRLPLQIRFTHNELTATALFFFFNSTSMYNQIIRVAFLRREYVRKNRPKYNPGAHPTKNLEIRIILTFSYLH